ncbi:MAG: T9SS type A sorting domain-containing protein [Flavobacteriia bacterium]|nr:T9SS type A sorting domain-containing protein [Flavobacteriia bacterium]
MKKNILILGLAIFSHAVVFSKNTEENLYAPLKDVSTHFIPAPDLDAIKIEDAKNDKNGMFYRIGVYSYTNLSMINSGTWKSLSSGEKMWQLNIKNTGAEALSFIFSSFNLAKGSKFFVQNTEGKIVSDVLTEIDEMEDLQQHIALCFGDNLILTLIDPNDVSPSEIVLNRVIYNYRSTGNPAIEKINESESCEVNVNCSEGANYQDEKKGIARVYVVEGSGAGWCSGSLVNNLANNCKPYFLTALHCGPSVNTSASNMNFWKFYFNYEAPTCVNPTVVGTLSSQYVSGCVRIADSNDNDGTNITKSDFLLVQMGTLANETATINKLIGFGAYWNGWDANNTAVTGGVGIHHPAGDIKKISTFNGALVSSSWGSTAGTHWRVTWSGTTNGTGVTEGGSSGSPLFTYNGGSSRIIGTLSGGSSYCTATTSPDLYGKVSYHWTSDGSTSTVQLKPFLDPNNSGTLVLNGSSNPCNFVGIKEATLNADAKVYPNPVLDIINIDLTEIANQKVAITIYDISGKLVFSSTNASGNLIHIDISTFEKGIYQVILKAEGQQFTQRISKI